MKQQEQNLKSIYCIIVIVGLAALATHAAAQQNAPSFELGSITTPRTINPAANSTTPSSLAGQQQNPFLGSLPTGTISNGPVALSLSDAITLVLRYNLGVIQNHTSLPQAQANRCRPL